MNIKQENIPDNFHKFVEKYQGNFEKRKYFKINQDLKISEKEPSWVLELSLIYYETKDSAVLDLLNSELDKCFKDKINDLGISQIYYDYRNRTYINTAEEWCRNYHVPYRRKED